MMDPKFFVAKKIAGLARAYNPLQSSDNLRAALAAGTGITTAGLEKRMLHQIINDVLLAYHNGETSLKAMLVKKFIQSKVVAAFEIKVNNSRADFLTINGDSKSFEIKSEFDNLSKLSKQVADYEKVFDFNYIVIGERHYEKALKIIPERYGILLLNGKRLVELKKGLWNDRHDVHRQLALFSKKELEKSFPVPGITKDEILVNFTDKEINDRFKMMLKSRYARRWSFLVNNVDSIHPVDYQFFFQHNLAPEIIYNS